MNWRAILGICAGVLLPLPLLLLLRPLVQPEIKPVEPAGQRISPVLDIEHRTRLMTYGRGCESSAECDPPLGCLYVYRYGRSFCTDSQCNNDAQCPEGQVCRKLATEGEGPLVRSCTPARCAPGRRELRRSSGGSEECLCSGADMRGKIWVVRPPLPARNSSAVSRRLLLREHHARACVSAHLREARVPRRPAVPPVLGGLLAVRAGVWRQLPADALSRGPVLPHAPGSASARQGVALVCRAVR